MMKILIVFSLGAYLCWLIGIGFTTIANRDIGLHLKTGEIILSEGFISTNVVSPLFADREMVDDKWLFQVFVAALFDLGGDRSLSVLKGIIVIGLGALLFFLCGGIARPWSLMVASIVMIACSGRFMIRPDLLSLFFFASVLCIVQRYRSTLSSPSLRSLWLLIPIQIIWVNVHGYYILGPMTVFLFAGSSWLEQRLGAERRGSPGQCLMIAALMVLACFVHPDFEKGAISFWTTLQDLWDHGDFYRATILEFRPTWTETPEPTLDLYAYRFLIILAIGLVGIFWRSFSLFHTALLIVLFFISSDLIRNIGFFSIGVAAASGELVRWRGPPKKLERGLRLAVGLSMSALVWLTFSNRIYGESFAHRSFGLGFSTTAYPLKECDWIRENMAEDRLWAPFSHGSFLTYELWPNPKMIIDGNTSGYPVSHLKNHVREAAGEVPISTIESRYGVKSFVVSPRDELAQVLFKHPDYSLAMMGEMLFVFVKLSALGERPNLCVMLERGEFPQGFLDAFSRPRLARNEFDGCGLVYGLGLSGLVEAADKLLSTIEARSQDRFEVFQTRGWLSMLQNSSTRAFEAFDRALALKPSASEVLADRARLHVMRGDLASARDDLEAALKRFSGDFETWRQRAEVAVLLGEKDEERSCLERAFALKPEHIGTRIRLSEIYSLDKRNHDRAKRLLEALMRDDNPSIDREEIRDRISRLGSP